MFFLIFLGCMQSMSAMEMSNKQTQDTNNILFDACKKGNVGLVKYLIEKGANVNAENNNKRTLLSFASILGHLELVKYLVEKGATIDIGSETSWVPLIVSSFKGHVAIVKHLVEKGANVNIENCTKHTPLHVVCETGHFELVKYLIEKNANVNLANTYGNTPLYFASKQGHLKIVKHLIEKGANVDAAANNQKWAPLHVACQEGHINITEYLIEIGANIHVENDHKCTPLHVACDNGCFEIVRYLLGQKVNINAESDLKGTPLHFACQSGYFEIVRYLIEKGANINAEVEGKITLLHLAVRNDYIDIVRYLLSSAPNLIDVQTIDGFTALDIAYELKKEAIVKVFTKYGIRTTSDKQADENMRAFFAELDQEALKAQIKYQQIKQKKLQNQKDREPRVQSITNMNSQKKGKTNQKVNVPFNNPTAVISDNNECIISSQSIETNTIATHFVEPATISSDNAIVIPTKKQQSTIQTSCDRPIQVNQPIRINNEYQVGHDIKLKWPRSLSGDKYNLMREHLRQLKHWPKVTGLDIKPLKDQSGMLRLRVGGYRVLFTVDDAQHRIIIHVIKLRKNVYKNMNKSL